MIIITIIITNNTTLTFGQRVVKLRKGKNLQNLTAVCGDAHVGHKQIHQYFLYGLVGTNTSILAE